MFYLACDRSFSQSHWYCLYRYCYCTRKGSPNLYKGYYGSSCCHMRRRGEAWGICPPPPKKTGKYISGKFYVKFGHLVNFARNVSPRWLSSYAYACSYHSGFVNTQLIVIRLVTYLVRFVSWLVGSLTLGDRHALSGERAGDQHHAGVEGVDVGKYVRGRGVMFYGAYTAMSPALRRWRFLGALSSYGNWTY